MPRHNGGLREETIIRGSIDLSAAGPRRGGCAFGRGQPSFFCERRIFSTRMFSSWREVDEKRGILARDEERHLGRKVSSISFPFVFTSV